MKLYHGTTSDRLDEIFSKGLRPSTGDFGKGLFLVDDPQLALAAGPVVLEVEVDQRKGIKQVPSSGSNETLPFTHLEYVFRHTIPPKDITVYSRQDFDYWFDNVKDNATNRWFE